MSPVGSEEQQDSLPLPSASNVKASMSSRAERYVADDVRCLLLLLLHGIRVNWAHARTYMHICLCNHKCTHADVCGKTDMHTYRHAYIPAECMHKFRTETHPHTHTHTLHVCTNARMCPRIGWLAGCVHACMPACLPVCLSIYPPIPP